MNTKTIEQPVRTRISTGDLRKIIVDLQSDKPRKVALTIIDKDYSAVSFEANDGYSYYIQNENLEWKAAGKYTPYRDDSPYVDIRREVLFHIYPNCNKGEQHFDECEAIAHLSEQDYLRFINAHHVRWRLEEI